ncbi:MAG: (5-formylfuran-3-yl)methyl phosphate synthase [Candidatus Thorarchaeota archaeon SMTZ1-83]
MTKLLVSPTDENDAAEAVAGGADIIDVKDPTAGSLGAAVPELIRRVKKAVGKSIPVSAALGDVPNLPGTVAQAALGASIAGADYVKVGLHGTRNHEDARGILGSVVQTLDEFNRESITVAALYADHNRAGTLDPLDLPSIVQGIGVGVVMLDTAIKDGRNLFDFLSDSEVSEFVLDSKNQDLEVALAGSLNGESFARAARLKPDIIGVRTAALTDGDRNSGRVDSSLVAELKGILKHHSV